MDEKGRKQTLAISSPIVTNGLMSLKRAPNDITRLCWSERASNTRGREKFADWARSMTSSATANIESRVTRTYSRAELGFAFLSTKGRTTSNCQAINFAMANSSSILLAFIQLRVLKFKQILRPNFNLAQALVLERVTVYYGDDEF